MALIVGVLLLLLLVRARPVSAQGSGTAAMTLTITGPTSLPEPGGFVTHTLQITNNFNDVGVPDFSNIYLSQIEDTFYGNLVDAANPNLASTTCTLATIAAGTTYSCTFAGVFTGNAGAERTHTVQTAGFNLIAGIVQASAAHTVQIAPRAPTLAVRNAGAATIGEPGGALKYTVTVTNTSVATDPVLLTILRDSVFGNLVNRANPAISNSTCTLAAIAPGSAYSCTFEGGVTGNAGQSLLNTVTARAQDDEGALSGFASSSHTVAIVDVIPTLVLTTGAAPSAVLESGESVSFTVEVGNKSVEEVTLSSLTSAVLGDLAGKGSCAASPQIIAAGGSYSCSFSSELSGDASSPPQQIPFAAQAADDENNSVSAQSTNSISFSDAKPAIDVQLGADPNDAPEGGADVLFKISVKNQSTEPVQLEQLSDAILGDLHGKGDCVADGSQTVGGEETYRCEFIAQVVGDFGDPERRYLVTGTASDNEGNSAQDQDATNIAFFNVPAEIALSQTPAVESVPEIGGDVSYALRLENRSLVDMVTIAQLTDSLVGDLSRSGGDLLTTDCVVPLALEPGASVGCTFTVRVTGNAGSSRTSEATAAGSDEDGDNVLATGSATVQIEDTPSSLRLVVSADGEAAPPVGRTIVYTVAVQNDSLVDLVTVEKLSDSVSGDLTDATNDQLLSTNCTVPQPLAVNQTYQCQYSLNVAGELGETIAGKVNAVGEDDDGVAVEASAERQVQIVAPIITVTKKDILLIDADGDLLVSPGDTILYQISIQNVGNVAAQNLVFEDVPHVQTSLVPGSVQTSEGKVESATQDASVQIHLDALAPNGTTSISFQVVINDSAVSGELSNQAQVRFSNPFDSTNGQSVVFSDDPDTPRAEDATATPLGGFISAIKLYLPVMKQQ